MRHFDAGHFASRLLKHGMKIAAVHFARCGFIDQNRSIARPKSRSFV
jgi:RNA:NAD 2'-phosphotransferase (TPT1/KptA family)